MRFDQPSDAMHVARHQKYGRGLGNGLLPDDTKALPDLDIASQ